MLAYEPTLYLIDYIHLLKVNSETEKEIALTIVTRRPGLLIGRGGETITFIQNRMLDCFKKKFSINISEFDPLYQDNEQLAKHFKG